MVRPSRNLMFTRWIACFCKLARDHAASEFIRANSAAGPAENTFGGEMFRTVSGRLMLFGSQS